MMGTCTVCGRENMELDEQGRCADHRTTTTPAEGGMGGATPAEGGDTAGQV